MRRRQAHSRIINSHSSSTEERFENHWFVTPPKMLTLMRQLNEVSLASWAIYPIWRITWQQWKLRKRRPRLIRKSSVKVWTVGIIICENFWTKKREILQENVVYICFFPWLNVVCEKWIDMIVCVQRRLVIHFYFSSSTTAYFLLPFDVHVFLLSVWAVLQCRNAAHFPQGWIAKSHKDATSSFDGTEGVGRDMGRGSKRLSVHLGLYFISLLRGSYFKNSFVIFQFVKFLYCLIV